MIAVLQGSLTLVLMGAKIATVIHPVHSITRQIVLRPLVPVFVRLMWKVSVVISANLVTITVI